MKKHLWLVAIALAAALVAGGVTFGVSRLARPGQDTEVERAYRAGVDALSRNDYPRAYEQFSDVASSSPNYKDINALLAQASAGLAASGDSTGTGGSTSPADGALDTTSTPGGSQGTGGTGGTGVATGGGVNDPGYKRPADLKSVLPLTLPGYNPPLMEAAGDLATAVYLPAQKGAVRQVTITVADRKSASGAAGFLTKTIKAVYSKDPAVVTLSQGMTAYFGTSQSLYATVGWTRGPLAYQVLVDVETGQPRDQKKVATDVAKQVK
jgi:hypothetical protein